MRFRNVSAFRREGTRHSWRALKTSCLFTFAALSLLASSGILRSLQAQSGPDKPHSVTISWSPNSPPVAGYNVYRVSPPAPPVKLTRKIISVTQYIDKTVQAGHTYSYSVTAVNFKGGESSPSGIITVTIPANAPPPAKQ